VPARSALTARDALGTVPSWDRSSFAPLIAPSLIFAAVTASFFSFAAVIAPFLICLVPIVVAA
jgi:hypothetical protein